MNLRAKVHNLLKGGFSTLIASVFSKLFVFIVNVLVARYSLAADYGVFALIRSAVVSLETVVSSALSPIFIKKMSETPDKSVNSAIFVLTLLISLFVSLLTYSLIGKSIEHLNIPLNGMWVAFLCCLLTSSLLNSILISNKLFSEMVISNIISLALSFSIYFFIYDWKFEKNAERILVIFYLTDVVVKIAYLKIKSTLGNFSLKTFITSINDFINRSHVKLLIATLINAVIFFKVRYDLGLHHSMDELADFDIAYQYLMVLILIQNSFTTVLLSTYVANKKNGQDSSKFYRLSSLYLMLFSIAIAVLLALLAPFSPLIFGVQYSIEPIYGIAFTVPAFSAALLLNRYMIAAGKEHVVTWAALVPSLALYLFSRLLNPDAVGLSWGFSGYYVVSILVYGVFIYIKVINSESKTKKTL